MRRHGWGCDSASGGRGGEGGGPATMRARGRGDVGRGSRRCSHGPAATLARGRGDVGRGSRRCSQGAAATGARPAMVRAKAAGADSDGSGLRQPRRWFWAAAVVDLGRCGTRYGQQQWRRCRRSRRRRQRRQWRRMRWRVRDHSKGRLRQR